MEPILPDHPQVAAIDDRNGSLPRSLSDVYTVAPLTWRRRKPGFGSANRSGDKLAACRSVNPKSIQRYETQKHFKGNSIRRRNSVAQAPR